MHSVRRNESFKFDSIKNGFSEILHFTRLIFSRCHISNCCCIELTNINCHSGSKVGGNGERSRAAVSCNMLLLNTVHLLKATGATWLNVQLLRT